MNPSMELGVAIPGSDTPSGKGYELPPNYSPVLR